MANKLRYKDFWNEPTGARTRDPLLKSLLQHTNPSHKPHLTQHFLLVMPTQNRWVVAPVCLKHGQKADNSTA